MRKLMWFTMGYALSCAVGTWLLRGRGVALAGLLFLVLTAGASLGRNHPVGRLLLAVLMGCAMGCFAFFGYETFILNPVAALDGQEIPVKLYVDDYSWETEYGSAVDGTIELHGVKYKVRCYLNEDTSLKPGDIVETKAKLRLTDEGGSREPTFHRTSGILLLLYQRGGVVVRAGEERLIHKAAHWRHRLASIIEACFPSDTFAFAKALLLGDKTDMDYANSTSFSVSGISHVIAVSGLHVSILCAVLFQISSKRRYLTAMICVPVLIFFAAVVGFTASMTRAVIMQILMMLAIVLDREYDPPTALAAAVLVMLLKCPLQIASIGLQLSVASVVGIFLFYEKLMTWLKGYFPGKGKTVRGRLERWFASSVAVTMSATVMTAPLTAIHFGTVSLIGSLTNLLVLFVISGTFYGIMLVCLTSIFRLSAAGMLAKIVSQPIRYVLAVAGFLEQIPMAAVYTASPYIVIWIIFVYALLAWLMATKKKRPAWASLLALLSLSVSLILSFLEPLTCDYRVTVLDVGQGQCIVLQSEGSTFVVDCGGDYDDAAADAAARMLLSQGVGRIDGLILTHYDRDHAGGVSKLAHRITVDRIYLPGTEDADGYLSDILKLETEFIPIDSDMTITFADAQIQIFPAKDAGSGNDSCASVLFQREKCDTLITGDLSAAAERQLLTDYELPDLEVLIVGHHGSKYSTCTELLKATAPDVAIISVGADNRYGHPTQEVLKRLEAAGCAVYRTDLHGTITYRG